MAILNELLPSSGKVTVNGTLAYAPQEAWILSDTVRANVLFGEPYNPAQYTAVIKACQLERDFELFDQVRTVLFAPSRETLLGPMGVLRARTYMYDMLPTVTFCLL